MSDTAGCAALDEPALLCVGCACRCLLPCCVAVCRHYVNTGTVLSLPASALHLLLCDEVSINMHFLCDKLCVRCFLQEVGARDPGTVVESYMSQGPRGGVMAAVPIWRGTALTKELYTRVNTYAVILQARQYPILVALTTF